MPNQIPEPIRNNAELAFKRRAAGLSQTALAHAMHMTTSALSRLETGRTDITPSRGAHAALVLAWLSQSTTTPSPRPQLGRPPGIKHNEIVTLWRTLAEDNQGPITREEALMLPPGTLFECLTATGREPDEAMGDKWSLVYRTDHPSQPFRAAADPVAPSAWLDAVVQRSQK